MANIAKYFLLTVCICLSVSVLAQKPKTAAAPMQKFSPPKLTCVLGIRKDSTHVHKEEALQLVKLPLKITDDKNNAYSISSYQFMYKRRVVSEDEQTGKAIPVMSNVSDIFRVTPLPEKWVNIISEQFKAGEELYFFDIVVKDAQGRLMYAPTLSIKIK